MPLTPFFWGCTKQVYEVGAGKSFWGGGGGVVWELAHNELDVAELEGVLIGVVIQEEEEFDPGKIVDGMLS